MNRLTVTLVPIAVSLVLLVALRLDGHESRPDVDPGLARAWQQPEQAAHRFPEPISRSRWQFDFGAAEETLRALRFTADHEIALDEATLVLMTRLHDWQSAPESTGIDHARVRFLISKSFPNPRCSDSFADLFARFSALDAAEERRLSSLRAEGATAPIDLPHEEKLRLQAQFFSEDEIEGLFARQNRLNGYLASRNRVIANADLSDTQRAHALASLEPGGDVEPDKVLRNGPCR